MLIDDCRLKDGWKGQRSEIRGRNGEIDGLKNAGIVDWMDAPMKCISLSLA